MPGAGTPSILLIQWKRDAYSLLDAYEMHSPIKAIVNHSHKTKKAATLFENKMHQKALFGLKYVEGWCFRAEMSGKCCVLELQVDL